MKKSVPILEFDPSPQALVEPSKSIKRNDVSEHCVISFCKDVTDKIVKENAGREVYRVNTVCGDYVIFEIIYSSKQLVIFSPGIGAPLAAGILEEVIALGCRKFISFGSAGILDKDLTRDHVIVPLSAIRDEGTSYHYIPSSREVEPSNEATSAIETILKKHSYKYLLSKVWTTDGYYRETKAKIDLRKSEGCVAVDMEAAALFAVAQFRKVKIGTILYNDNIGADQTGFAARQKLFNVAAEACFLV